MQDQWYHKSSLSSFLACYRMILYKIFFIGRVLCIPHLPGAGQGHALPSSHKVWAPNLTNENIICRFWWTEAFFLYTITTGLCFYPNRPCRAASIVYRSGRSRYFMENILALPFFKELLNLTTQANSFLWGTKFLIPLLCPSRFFLLIILRREIGRASCRERV